MLLSGSLFVTFYNTEKYRINVRCTILEELPHNITQEDPYTHISRGFEPVFSHTSRILILGSIPSVLSRKQNFYYGNPQNRFWRVMARILNEDVPASIPEKRTLLLDHHIALWDVIESCDIIGSKDATIRNAVPVSLEFIFKQASIEAVFANGRAAQTLFQRYCEPRYHRTITLLPSTSPANAAWNEERLFERWSELLGPYLLSKKKPQPH